MEDPTRIAILAHFGKHVVALGGTYVSYDDEGNPSAERFFCYTGTLLSVKGEWWIATAGHIFSQLEPHIASGRIEIREQSVCDYVGVRPDVARPVPFRFLDAPKVWKDVDGLDFAVIPIERYYRRLFDTGHLLPLDERAYRPPPLDVDEFRFALYGFPERLVSETQIASTEPIIGHIKPVLNFIEGEAFDNTYPYPRFKAKLLGNIESAVGFSGGPVFTFIRRKGQDLYFLIALQASWHEPSRTVYGCPITVFMPLAKEMLTRGSS
jgi:hypothetical protein